LLIKLACNGRSKNLLILYPRLQSAEMLVCQNLVHVKEVLITVIINEETLCNKRLFRKRGNLVDFKSSLILTKFKMKMRKHQIFVGYIQK